MPRKGIELTDSARRKAEKAGLLKTTGSGKVRKEGENIVRRQSAASRAQNAARAALGARRKNQTTDSNN